MASDEIDHFPDVDTHIAQLGVITVRADFDVIVVGSGPAGVSTSFPMVEAGLKVLLVDGGREASLAPPSVPYLLNRAEGEKQWEWMAGRDYYVLRNVNAVSPKLRIPIHSYVFEDFQSANRIDEHGFLAIGSLARGGLSNAWGCGVARLAPHELTDFPFSSTDIEPSYETVTRRMGVSGAVNDDLSAYFGLDEWAEPPIQMDGLHSRIIEGYPKNRHQMTQLGFKLGRSRVAVLTHDRGERMACDLSGNCLWGCHRRALYSATEDLELLKRHTNFTYKSGFVVDRIVSSELCHALEGSDSSGLQTLTGRKIVLAAGTLASTRLALQGINIRKVTTMQANPTAAFMLWLFGALGSSRVKSFGLGQISFALSICEDVSGFGSLFNTSGIPVAEFARHMPLRKRYAIDLLEPLLSSCVVGNLFLPGHLAQTTLALNSDNSLRVEGRYRDDVPELMRFAEKRLRKAFWKLGALLLPKSFTMGHPGSSIHYACSLPMRAHPTYGETDAFGELFGLKGVYVADGASLSSLSEKSHTLTIMANADRIGRNIVKNLKNNEIC